MKSPLTRLWPIALLLVAIIPAPLVRAAESPAQLVGYYFDLLSSGNIESAGLMWSAADQERSSRFGIVYTDIPLRVDCTSPIVRNLPVMRNFLQPPVKQVTNLDSYGTYQRCQFSNLVNGKPVEWYYYAKATGDYFVLIYPQDFYGKDWPVVESKYFRVHAHPGKKDYLNSALLQEADNYVQRLADSLHLDKAAMTEMAQKKIEYFYCDNDSTVGTITGQATKGVLDLASNDVISADFPHFHEVSHLLINIKLKQLPLETLPLLREGLAVRFGGRWGKRSSALLDLGAYLYREKLVEIDSILTVSGFQSFAGADIAYPVAGIFASFLYDRLGQPKTFQLYRQLSRSDNALDTMNHVEVRRALVSALGQADWAAVMSDFDAYLNKEQTDYAVARPGGTNAGKPILQGDGFTVSQDKDWINFEFVFSGDSGAYKGNVLFHKDPRLVGQKSLLFEEQYGADKPFEGYRFGVRFDRNEAGLYDYATNELIAKYIYGISPEKDYFDENSKTIRIRFRTRLFDGVFPKQADYQFLPL